MSTCILGSDIIVLSTHELLESQLWVEIRKEEVRNRLLITVQNITASL